ncbi:hypothetical protein C8034_v005547 [Colletotrichum sidae]|uniref:BTB domain-containing protein n=1 Tax=Colletotrichum sidae TaxID=1347389 RepID=A0A4R8T6H5_9PEZI|nr:hypothetical protein C8034_v005547 [Colletotrichum sidae]
MSSISSSPQSVSLHELMLDLEPEASSEVLQTTPVAPNGEVLLLVGPNTHEIRVHALILCNSSPVFSSMLRSTQHSYSETTSVSSATPSTPARVILPEDDAFALDTICRITHNRAIPQEIKTMTPSQILKVAVAADKYDCAPALALAVEYWLGEEKLEGLRNAARDGCIGFGRCDLLMAAYWFKHERVFEEVTEFLITNAAGGYGGLGEEEEGLGWRLALALETRRNSLRLSLYTELMGVMHEPFFDYVRTRPLLWWLQPDRVQDARNMAVSKALRSIDREMFSTEMGRISICEAVSRAAEVPDIAYIRISSLSKVYDKGEPVSQKGRKPWYKKAMRDA